MMLRALAILGLAACSVPNVHFSNGDGGGGGSDDAPTVDAAAPGTYRWVRSLASMSPTGVAEGTSGVVVAGYFTTPVDLGAGNVIPIGATDMAVASYATADASYIYGVHHGDVNGTAFGFMNFVDPQGAPIVMGVSYGAKIDLGLGEVNGGGGAGADGYIGRYGPSTPTWVDRLVGTGEDKLLASALAPNGSVYGGGFFETSSAFNGTAIPGAGYRDCFLARLNGATGVASLTRHYGGTGRDEIASIAATSNNIFIGGFFDDALAFGGNAAVLTANTGGLDGYVAELDNNGDGVWAVQFGAAALDEVNGVAIDGVGDVYITGTFTGQVPFGSMILNSNGGNDIFVAKLNGSNGAVIWATSFGSTTDDNPWDIAVDEHNHVAVAASVTGPIDGGSTQGDFDGVLATFDADTGNSHWRKVFSGPGRDTLREAKFGLSGDLFAVLSMSALLDFGIPITGPANPTGVVMRIVP